MSMLVCRDARRCKPNRTGDERMAPCTHYVACGCLWSESSAHCKVCGHCIDCHVCVLETTQVPVLAAERLAG